MPIRIAITFQSTKLSRLDLVHGPHPDHDHDAQQRRNGGIELVDDDGCDRHGKNSKRQPLQHTHVTVPIMV